MLKNNYIDNLEDIEVGDFVGRIPLDGGVVEFFRVQTITDKYINGWLKERSLWVFGYRREKEIPKEPEAGQLWRIEGCPPYKVFYKHEGTEEYLALGYITTFSFKDLVKPGDKIILLGEVDV